MVQRTEKTAIGCRGSRERVGVTGRPASVGAGRREPVRAGQRASYYVYGAAASALASPERQEQSRAHEARNISRRNREKAAHMNPGYVLFMMALMSAMVLILISYIKLRSDLTSSVKEISAMESELSELRTANDEAYNEIDSSIDLDEIKYKAITELGMKYANEEQIVKYDNDADDYVHQVTQVK